ncbi:hypothetical protein ACIRSU_02890 [Streptomyces sp. NPDC101160]|uniref:hypothetical protein n=1 Tax=Streptomyces sp. NPDC101160 TaxID=3366118 RepID=UPI00382F1E7F
MGVFLLSPGVTAMFLLGGGPFSLLFLLPLSYQQVHGHSVLESGLLLAPLGLGNPSDRFGAKVLVPTGALLIGAGALTSYLLCRQRSGRGVHDEEAWCRTVRPTVRAQARPLSSIGVR